MRDFDEIIAAEIVFRLPALRLVRVLVVVITMTTTAPFSLRSVHDYYEFSNVFTGYASVCFILKGVYSFFR